VFGLHLRWGVRGFWAGLLATSVTMAVVQLAVIARFDWTLEVMRTAQALQEQQRGHSGGAADSKAPLEAAGAGAGAAAGAAGAAAAAAAARAAAGAAASAGMDERDEGGGSGVSDTVPLLDHQRQRSGLAPVKVVVAGAAGRE
jgi:hypothetical protein